MRLLLLICIAIGISFALQAEEHLESTTDRQPITQESLFELINTEIVNAVCTAPEFEACFDIPLQECEDRLRAIVNECKEELKEELPKTLTADEADPVLAEVYACVIPAWTEFMNPRKIESEECDEVSQDAAPDETETVEADGES